MATDLQHYSTHSHKDHEINDLCISANNGTPKKKTESKAVQTTSSISMEGPITNALSTHDYIYIQMTQDVSDETLT